MKIRDIKLNPSNPRLIRDEKFEKLKNSIKSFPDMLELRPIVIDENNMVLGGNMRLRACIELGYKEVPVTKAVGLTEEQKAEFIIKDNVGFGDWDWDMLANEWDSVKLEEWGLDSWQNMDDIEEKEEASSTKEDEVYIIGSKKDIKDYQIINEIKGKPKKVEVLGELPSDIWLVKK